MKKIQYKTVFITILITVLTIQLNLFPEEPQNKWNWFNGEWVVENSQIVEKRGWVSPWNYYALVDFNSIISISPLENYSTIEFTLTALNRHPDNTPRGKRELTDNCEFMASFAVTSVKDEWYYHLYGIKISGDKKDLNTVTLVYSDITDRTKKLSEKNNYFMKELASGKFPMGYDREYRVKIEIIKEKITFFLDGKPVLKGSLPAPGHDGRIGFSSRNLYVKIGNVKVSNNKGIIFQDSFDRDSLFIRKLKVKRADRQK